MSSNKYKVLIVEDEVNIRNLVKTILVTNGYQVFEAENLKNANMMFTSYSPDVIVLDLGLPDGDGMEFIQTVRQIYSVPIIVVSARTEEMDIVDALDAGANDYMVKPFGTAELLARVRSVLRSLHQTVRNSGKGKEFSLQNLKIDYDARQVEIDGVEVKLTQTEYNILVLLADNAGKVMTYAEIIREIWHFADVGSTKKLQVNMANIRKKLGIRPGDNRYIVNELGVGYRMNVEHTKE